MKEYYKHIFVVLVYRNIADVIGFIESVKKNVSNSKIIIVNSYYDDQSMKKVRSIATDKDCDFINIENKGFSFGNNVGIKYAIEYYEFEYVTCSNPDVVINKFDDTFLDCNPNLVYGPEITTADGKKQNPMMEKKYNRIYTLIYKSYKLNKRYLFIIAIILLKIFRSYGRLKHSFFNKRSYRVFQLHGCFLVFSKAFLLKVGMPFDESMFLFGEEGVLAIRAEKNNIPLMYTKNINILHKEDGSMSLFSGNINNELIKSNIYFYENYIEDKL
ncbi:hypothetical protein [Streptococcus porcinus]|uniref:Glycosyltransferase n=1 Tax=Streptococcus porcinus TaxID=1340 RepID=A0A7V9WT77_STRPO|nr:hypothetical protein [Streptococcus porcinus]MBA2796619.1 hypothetical protein [Streptococcus porcinus]